MLNPIHVVRPAVPKDVPALIRLMRALAEYEDYLSDFNVDEQALLSRAFGPSAQCRIFVADWLSELAGYAVVLEIPFTYDLRPTFLLKELYIAEHCRSAGLGQALLQQVAIWGLAKGAGRLKWDVLVGNQRAEAFYQRLGGRPDCKWTAYQMGSLEIKQLALGGGPI
ncbi:GNAT family N-acetyltransferase [Ectopseudomonas khazarica]|uniref:GNAT family N-acetyltransferase n=1 Tax=Ectopseudomonas khazarica TaxID=2502979 RepID=UPI0037CC8E8B